MLALAVLIQIRREDKVRTNRLIRLKYLNRLKQILFQRFDINGDGVLDEAEKVVGRRIMTEMFLDNHQHDIHLYGQGLSQKVAGCEEIKE